MFRKLRHKKYKKNQTNFQKWELLYLRLKIHWVKINEGLYIAEEKINELEDIAIETIVDT